MNADMKPILDQIKAQIKSQFTEANIELLKKQVTQGLRVGRQIFEAKAKEFYNQSKDSPILNDYVIPFIESESTTKAIAVMNDKLKLKNTPLMSSIIKIRQDLIESKVERAKSIQVDVKEPEDNK